MDRAYDGFGFDSFSPCLWLNVTPWWMLAAPFIYYLWYVLEYLIKVFAFGYRAYRHISFEQEAYDNQSDDDYVENRRMFTGWLRRIIKS